MLTIRIQQHDFSFPERFSTGHVLSEGEAAALNQMLAENVRNNVSGWVNKTLQSLHVTVLPTQSHNHLQDRIADYAARYQFRRRERSRTPSPIEAAADEIAQQQAETEMQQQGYAPNSEETKARFRQLRNDPAVLEQARSLVVRRQASATAHLKGVMDDD